VIGSSIETQYEIKDGKPVLMRLPKVHFIDGKAGTPVGINEFIGRRPVAAFGNSGGARLMMLVFHDDADREYDYGPANGLPDAKFGTFLQSLMNEKSKSGTHQFSRWRFRQTIHSERRLTTASMARCKA